MKICIKMQLLNLKYLKSQEKEFLIMVRGSLIFYRMRYNEYFENKYIKYYENYKILLLFFIL